MRLTKAVTELHLEALEVSLTRIQGAKEARCSLTKKTKKNL
jgi:hypothetical protein